MIGWDERGSCGATRKFRWLSERAETKSLEDESESDEAAPRKCRSGCVSNLVGALPGLRVNLGTSTSGAHTGVVEKAARSFDHLSSSDFGSAPSPRTAPVSKHTAPVALAFLRSVCLTLKK